MSDNKLEEARQAIAQSHWERALSHLRDVRGATREPAIWAEVLHLRGLVHWRKGEGETARQVLRDAVRLRRHLSGSALSASLNALGAVCVGEDLPDEAIQSLREALELRLRSGTAAEILTTVNNLTVVMMNAGQLKGALAVSERAASAARDTAGAGAVLTGRFLNNLAGLYERLGRYAEAESTYGESYAILVGELGNTHPDVLRTQGNQVRARALSESVQ